MSELHLSAVEIAHESLKQNRARQENARRMMGHYALAAVIAGEDINRIMDACGFAERPIEVPDDGMIPWSRLSIFGAPDPPSRLERFAAWIADIVTERVHELGGQA